MPREPPCSDQASGAYIFRPNSSELFGFDPRFAPTLEVEEGAVMAEVRMQTSPWASHTVRLAAGAAHLEVEWTAGPVPVATPWFQPVASDPATRARPAPWGGGCGPGQLRAFCVRFARALRALYGGGGRFF
mgnify:CR=1 FL=1